MADSKGKATREQIVGQSGQRRLTIDTTTINEEARTVEVVYATATPVRRWWGEEVLAIRPGAMRTARIDAGAAVLWNHRSDAHIGVIDSHSIDEGAGKARAVLRFSKVGQLANELWEKVREGTVRWVSVGYQVHGARLVEERDDGDTWEIDDWETVEISLVAIPADPNAGVGRSGEIPPEDAAAGNGNSAHLPQATPTATPPASARMPEAAQNPATPTSPAPAGPAPSADHGRDSERARTIEILELGQRFGALDDARAFVESGKSPADFQRHLLDTIDKRGGSSKPLSEQGSHGKELGLTGKEKRQYSLQKVLRLLADPQSREAQREAAFELECSDALEKQGTSRRGGVLVPPDYLSLRPDGTESRAWSAFNTSTSATNDGDTGGRLVDNVLMAGSFIEILRNRSFMLRRVRSMMGLVGNVTIPVQTGKGRIYWIGEGANAPETSMQVAHIGMSPKTAAAYNEITRRLLMQSTPDAEQLVRSDLALAMAEGLDIATIYANPSDTPASPRGIRYVDGINTVAFAASNAPTFAELVAMETAIAADNADIGSMAYVLNAAARGYLKTTQRFSSTNGATLWEPGNQINGYDTEVSNAVQAGDYFFGNFNDLLVGMWGGFELMVDPYAKALSGGIRYIVMQDIDLLLRRKESVCWGRYVAPTP